jgi:hypothetical protein
MLTLDEQIDYAFAAKYMNLYEKIAKRNHIVVFLTEVSRNPLITMSYVEKHLKKPWDWEGLTENPSISLEYMEAHPEHPWDRVNYAFRKAGRFDWPPVVGSYVGRNLAGIPSAWDASNVSLDDIETNMKWIDAHVVFDFDPDFVDHGPPCTIWEQISANPNLTLDFIEKYIDKPWKLCFLSENPLTEARERYKKEYKAALVIQEAYGKAKYIPTYAYCRKLHLDFYHQMFGQPV